MTPRRETLRFPSDSLFYRHRLFHGLCGMVVYFICSRGKRPTPVDPTSRMRLEHVRMRQVALQLESDIRSAFGGPFKDEDSAIHEESIRDSLTHWPQRHDWKQGALCYSSHPLSVAEGGRRLDGYTIWVRGFLNTRLFLFIPHASPFPPDYPLLSGIGLADVYFGVETIAHD